MKWFCVGLLSWLMVTALSAQKNPFHKIDKYALKAPKAMEEEVNNLANYLAKDGYTEKEIVRSFYTWIIHHISYDYEVVENTEKVGRQSISTILLNKKAICSGYATLFQKLCDLKGITSHVVSGYSKGTLTESPKVEVPDHAWNAVQIDSIWYLLDATWGSSSINGASDFSIQYNANYFLTDPKLLIVNHLPADPMWQLLDCPITVKDFQKRAEEITERMINQADKCFDYKDSIENYLQLEPVEQILKRATNEYLFNPTPKLSELYGHALLDYETKLSDIATSLQGTAHLDSLLRLQQQTIALCEKAAQHVTLYANQQENCTYNRFNYAIALYQSINEKTTETEKKQIVKEVIEHLEQAEKELQVLPSNFMTEQAITQCRQYIEYLKD